MRGLILFLPFLLFACTPVYRYVSSPPVVATHSITQVVRDTVVAVQIERDSVGVITPTDSVSYLRNRYSESTAAVIAGELHHTLNTISNANIDVPVQYIETHIRDSIPVPYPVEVERRAPLRWYERILVYLGIASICYSVIKLIIRLR